MTPRRLLLIPTTLVLLSSSAVPAHSATQIHTAKIAAAANGSWTVYHHDNAHTGFDASAPALGSVAPTAGWTETPLDAQVYAEPLIYNGLVYAATLNNTVYALDQSTGAVVWSRNLGAPVSSGWSCGNVSPQGILGTPVIDAAGGRIYVAALFNSDHLYHIFGLDLNTGNPLLATTMNIPASIGVFNWAIQQQRGALALGSGYVYVPFGGRDGDCGTYYGWVVGFPTNGSTSLVVYRTAGSGSGIWGAGGPIVDDSTGNVFAATGNGVAGGCGSVDQNDAVVRLSPTLALQDWFMPTDWQNNWCNNDQDLGSAGPVLISPFLMFQAGKRGDGFLLNPKALGHVNDGFVRGPVCFGNNSDATFGSFAYAAPFVYVECEGHGIVALNVNTGTPTFSPCDAACAPPNWHSAVTATFGPPIVAGGAVWAADHGGSGLYAFDATTGAQIYHSASFGVNRFVTPAEAGGQVFVPAKTVIKSFSFTSPPPPPPPSVYTAVNPTRLLDTRTNGGPLGAGASRNLVVAGGTTSVPAAATSVVLNVTATNTTASSYLTVYPSGALKPTASNLNWTPGQTVPNLVAVQVGNVGQVTMFNGAGSTDVVVDVEGYFSTTGTGTAGEQVALPPARITDTRPGSGLANAGATLGPNSSLDVVVRGAGGVPAMGVSAAILNVTVTNTTAFSYLTAWPTSATRPTASNLNWVPGQTVPNRVVVPVDVASGKVSLYNAFGSTDVVVDVSGYFTDGTATGKQFSAMSPVRIKDTRISGGTLGPGQSFPLQVTGSNSVPATATAVVINVTVTNTSAPSFLTVYPCGTRPNASDLNWIGGQTVPNLTVATLSATGAICFYNSAGSTDVVVDLSGYFN